MSMAGLPGRLGSSVTAWRVDAQNFAATWDSGIGAERFGGRWNPKGLRVVYCSFDPATTVLELAVHKGFEVLDTHPFVLTSLAISESAVPWMVGPNDVPNPAWLHAGTPSSGQQAWGADMLARHPFVVFPSVVSKRSWNVVFRPDVASGQYQLLAQERLVLDTRLNQPR